MGYPIKNKKILITGGAGFVGSYIAELLLEQEPAQIVLIDNLIRGRLDNIKNIIDHPNVKFIEDDIRNRDLMDQLLADADYLYHLAALRITRCADDPVDAHSVMIDALFHIIESARKHGIEKVVFASSASIYGMAEHFPTTESEAPHDNRTLYGAAKYYGEGLLRSYHDMYGLNYTALRFFNIYGPRMDIEGKYTEVMIKWLDCMRDGRQPLIFGDGSDTADYVYITDIARACVNALTSSATDEVFNIGTGIETSLKELLDVMLDVYGSDLQPKYEAARKVNPVARRKADISKAKELLDFQPQIDLRSGVEMLTDWYKSMKGEDVNR